MRQKQKILHSPRNLCNIPWVLAQEQKKLGYVSHVMKHDDDIIGSECDYNLKISRFQRWSLRYLTYLLFAVKAALKYDIFIFHTGITLLPDHKELSVLKVMGKKIFFYFHGKDINPNGLPEHIKYADHYFVSTPDLFKYAPNATWLPQAIDLESYPEQPVFKQKGDATLTILHAINEDTAEKRRKKGTDVILNAIDQVKSKGYDIKLDFVVATTRVEFIYHLQKADIVIDQINVAGWYGVIAVEAMFYGKPVLVYIHDDLKLYLPAECPLITTSSEKLENDLIKLIETNDFLYYRKKGPEYVEINHSVKMLVSKLHDIILK